VRRNAVKALVQRGRDFKIVTNSSSLAGQIAAVESGPPSPSSPNAASPKASTSWGANTDWGG